MNYNKIRELLEQKNITIIYLCRKAKITYSGFVQMMDKETMKVDTLEKIALILEVPVSYFFDEVLSPKEAQTDTLIHTLTTELETLKKELQLLKIVVENQNFLIQTLREQKLKT